MNEPAAPPAAIPPGPLGAGLAGVVVEKAAAKLLPAATPEQRRAAATLLAPWAEKFVRALDEIVRIPGTKIGIGLDAILGFFLPGVGDVVTGAGALSLLFLALRHKVPTVAIGRMLVNIGIDTLVGSIPVVGDVFDLFWKSNRRNLAIIQRYADDPQQQPTPGDHALVGLGILLVVCSVVLPVVFAFFFGASLFALVGTFFSLLQGGGP
jgi:hypothetical protein